MTEKNSLKPAVRRIAWRPTTPIPKTLSVTISQRKRECGICNPLTPSYKASCARPR